MAPEDLVQDGWTDLAKRIRNRILQLPADQRNPMGMLAAYEDADHEKMEEIRQRAEAVVRDAETAEKLKAWYRQLCKRPCFHDQYLQAFNEPAAHLIDTDGQGVERITEKGVVVKGVEYEVDCIVYASGFEVGTPLERRTGFDPRGRGGIKLSQYWADGMRTKHGMHVHNFPNAFLVQATQAANLISNYPHNLVDSARTISLIVSHAEATGAKEVEVSKQAEDDWVNLLLSGMGLMIGSPDCTPGYYNNEGRDPGPQARYFVGYPAGAVAFFNYIEGWRTSGAFEGVAFRKDA
jgi:cation diffusion facilitator CzcD-associated flavoprotein CzcO